ncbi:MAG: hypothetical protein HOO91_12455 [Bacteroidales bacterium]|nr:hypothetical protein [Bacteroidales bacterium]
MAGICGIIQKKSKVEEGRLNAAFERMLSRLPANSNQSSDRLVQDSFWIGKSFPITHGNEPGIIHNPELSVYGVIEGLVYVNDSAKTLVQGENREVEFSSQNQYIPYLYAKYSIDFVKHLTGWFNIFLFDQKQGLAILVNDRIGFLPMFIYDSGEEFIFASKIESILASGLMASIGFDAVSCAEQFLFNYQLSNHSLIKNINTLSAATVHQLKPDGENKTIYWSPRELIVEKPLPRKEGFEIINQALEVAISKAFANHQGDVAITLTGGWDGRLVLSYALGKFSERTHTFSYGTTNSPDIVIPQTIAQSEGFRYKPFLLDQTYIGNYFPDSASSTIILSNGVRGYRRAPYLYVMPKLLGISNLILSGNFGDEMLKFAALKPSEVQSEALINYIQSDFKERPHFPHQLFQDQFLTNTNSFDLIDEWNCRLQGLEDEMSCYNNRSKKYNHLKLTRIANRFFGYEVNSYNDYTNSFSPFLDFDFITAFSKTIYCGIYHPFNENRIKDKELIAMLYASLVKKNHKTLAKYNTDRGYSMDDVTNPFGKILAYTKKRFSKGALEKESGFSEHTSKLFDQLHQSAYPDSFEKYLQYPYDKVENGVNKNLMSRVQSLEFWIGYITNQYLK